MTTATFGTHYSGRVDALLDGDTLRREAAGRWPSADCNVMRASVTCARCLTRITGGWADTTYPSRYSDIVMDRLWEAACFHLFGGPNQAGCSGYDGIPEEV